jgi:hypothetical protein
MLNEVEETEMYIENPLADEISSEDVEIALKMLTKIKSPGNDELAAYFLLTGKTVIYF